MHVLLDMPHEFGAKALAVVLVEASVDADDQRVREAAGGKRHGKPFVPGGGTTGLLSGKSARAAT